MVTHLEDVGEVSQVEDVVELDGSREEGGGDLGVECKCTLHHLRRELLQLLRESANVEVLRENRGVDVLQSVHSYEKHRPKF